MAWEKYHNYSGILLRGTANVEIPIGSNKFNHMQRAAYLTSQLEAPTWGTVQSYDGAGISGSLCHFIACYPSTGDQGLLFSCINYIATKVDAKNQNLVALLQAVHDQNWTLVEKGVVDASNKLISGRIIRNVVAPVNGTVPQVGPNREQADKWALLLHNLLADPATFAAQTEFTINYLLYGYQSKEKEIYDIFMGKSDYSVKELQAGLEVGKLSFEADLAMCFYHSASVNAPGIAIKSLVKGNKETLAKNIIRSLGTTQYGAWKERYTQARATAKASNLYPNSLFEPNGIMPVRF